MLSTFPTQIRPENSFPLSPLASTRLLKPLFSAEHLNSPFDPVPSFPNIYLPSSTPPSAARIAEHGSDLQTSQHQDGTDFGFELDVWSNTVDVSDLPPLIQLPQSSANPFYESSAAPIVKPEFPTSAKDQSAAPLPTEFATPHPSPKLEVGPKAGSKVKITRSITTGKSPKTKRNLNLTDSQSVRMSARVMKRKADEEPKQITFYRSQSDARYLDQAKHSIKSNELEPATQVEIAEPWKNAGVLIGQYTREERQAKIERYKEKKNKRKTQNFVRYNCRAEFANKRPRIGGRFIKLPAKESKEGFDTPMSTSRSKFRAPATTAQPLSIPWYC